MLAPDIPPPAYPPQLTAYPAPSPDGLLATLLDRVQQVPFNAVATSIFLLAILHTFLAARFSLLAHDEQHRHAARLRAAGHPTRPSVAAELLHFLGEVAVVFGLWAVVLGAAIAIAYGWATVVHYLDTTVNYTEPLFVVVIMALAATRPIVTFAEASLARIATVPLGMPWRGKEVALELPGQGTLDPHRVEAGATFELDIKKLGLAAPKFFVFKMEDEVTAAVTVRGAINTL